MPNVTVIYGEEQKSIQTEPGSLLGDVIAETGLPLEQPCAGRGTCGKCKVLVEKGVRPPDEIEFENLTPGEIALNNRLACRARVDDDARVVLTPIVVYSNKIFKSSSHLHIIMKIKSRLENIFHSVDRFSILIKHNNSNSKVLEQ